MTMSKRFLKGVITKVISFLLAIALISSMIPNVGLIAYASGEGSEPIIIDRLCIDFTTENAHPGAEAYELTKELRKLDGKNISNGTEDVGYCGNVYLFSYTEPNREGTREQIESSNTDLLDLEHYYYANIEIEAKNGFDFKHDGTSFDTTSLTTVVNGHEMTGIADSVYNEYWKLIDLFIPIEIDTTSKVYSVEITNSDVNVEKGNTIQFQSKIVSYGDGYDAVVRSVEGAEKAGTTISSTGLLTVAADETADSITVKVCSIKDAEKYDTVTLNVLDKLAIDSVAIEPQNTTLFAGDSEVFTATVIGTDTHEVEWQLTGNNSANTTITPNGQTCTLAVGEDETAEALSIKVTSVKDPTKSATASVTVKQLTIIDRLLINYTTEKAVVGVTAYELTKELRELDGKNISNGTEDVGYCGNVYLFSYTEPNREGTREQIESSNTDLLDLEHYYYANIEIEAKKGFDFKHTGTVFDQSSLTTVVNGADMPDVAGSVYNEYWKLIDLYIPIEIKCNHSQTTTIKEDLVPATTSADGQYTEIVKCDVCKKEVTRSGVVIPKVASFALSTTTYTYNGKVKRPSVTVKDSMGRQLQEDTDYTVTYASGRKYVGKYKVTVTLKGNYSGTKSLYLTINPSRTGISKISAARKSLKVRIKKKTSQVTGYQIQYSTSKTFKSKYAKIKTVTSYKTTYVTLKSLKAKRTYYVRVRTYKTVSGKRYYSGWSSYKYKKTK